MPVYIARFGLTGPCKIGCSTDVAMRLAGIGSRLWDDMRLLRLFDGGLADEAKLHRRFKPQRIRQEWFHYHPDMMDDLGLTEITRKLEKSLTVMLPRLRDGHPKHAAFSDALRCWMLKKNLREDELAQLVGCKVSVSIWLKHGHPPSYKYQDRLRDLSDGELFPTRVRLTAPKTRFTPLALA
jgi:Meiotically up-regulated gene 113